MMSYCTGTRLTTDKSINVLVPVKGYIPYKDMISYCTGTRLTTDDSIYVLYSYLWYRTVPVQDWQQMIV